MITEIKDAEAMRIRLSEINLELSRHSISANRKKFMSDTIPIELEKKRVELISEKLKLERLLANENKQRKSQEEAKHYGSSEQFNFAVLTILTETFGVELKKKITNEAKRRMAGYDAVKISFSEIGNDDFKKEAKRLKEAATNLKDTLLFARRTIDAYMRQNEPEINKADWLAKMRPIIKCMPSEKEIYGLTIDLPASALQKK